MHTIFLVESDVGMMEITPFHLPQIPDIGKSSDNWSRYQKTGRLEKGSQKTYDKKCNAETGEICEGYREQHIDKSWQY